MRRRARRSEDGDLDVVVAEVEGELLVDAVQPLGKLVAPTHQTGEGERPVGDGGDGVVEICLVKELRGGDHQLLEERVRVVDEELVVEEVRQDGERLLVGPRGRSGRLSEDLDVVVDGVVEDPGELVEALLVVQLGVLEGEDDADRLDLLADVLVAEELLVAEEPGDVAVDAELDLQALEVAEPAVLGVGCA